MSYGWKKKHYYGAGVGDLISDTQYSVSYDLQNCSCQEDMITTINQGQRYTWTITANEGYRFAPASWQTPAGCTVSTVSASTVDGTVYIKKIIFTCDGAIGDIIIIAHAIQDFYTVEITTSGCSSNYTRSNDSYTLVFADRLAFENQQLLFIADSGLTFNTSSITTTSSVSWESGDLFNGCTSFNINFKVNSGHYNDNRIVVRSSTPPTLVNVEFVYDDTIIQNLQLKVAGSWVTVPSNHIVRNIDINTNTYINNLMYSVYDGYRVASSSYLNLDSATSSPVDFRIGTTLTTDRVTTNLRVFLTIGFSNYNNYHQLVYDCNSALDSPYAKTPMGIVTKDALYIGSATSMEDQSTLKIAYQLNVSSSAIQSNIKDLIRENTTLAPMCGTNKYQPHYIPCNYVNSVETDYYGPSSDPSAYDKVAEVIHTLTYGHRIKIPGMLVGDEYIVGTLCTDDLSSIMVDPHDFIFEHYIDPWLIPFSNPEGVTVTGRSLDNTEIYTRVGIPAYYNLVQNLGLANNSCTKFGGILTHHELSNITSRNVYETAKSYNSIEDRSELYYGLDSKVLIPMRPYNVTAPHFVLAEGTVCANNLVETSVTNINSQTVPFRINTGYYGALHAGANALSHNTQIFPRPKDKINLILDPDQDIHYSFMYTNDLLATSTGSYTIDWLPNIGTGDPIILFKPTRSTLEYLAGQSLVSRSNLPLSTFVQATNHNINGTGGKTSCSHLLIDNHANPSEIKGTFELNAKYITCLQDVAVRSTNVDVYGIYHYYDAMFTRAASDKLGITDSYFKYPIVIDENLSDNETTTNAPITDSISWSESPMSIRRLYAFPSYVTMPTETVIIGGNLTDNGSKISGFLKDYLLLSRVDTGNFSLILSDSIGSSVDAKLNSNTSITGADISDIIKDSARLTSAIRKLFDGASIDGFSKYAFKYFGAPEGSKLIDGSEEKVLQMVIPLNLYTDLEYLHDTLLQNITEDTITAAATYMKDVDEIPKGCARLAILQMLHYHIIPVSLIRALTDQNLYADSQVITNIISSLLRGHDEDDNNNEHVFGLQEAFKEYNKSHVYQLYLGISVKIRSERNS